MLFRSLTNGGIPPAFLTAADAVGFIFIISSTAPVVFMRISCGSPSRKETNSSTSPFPKYFGVRQMIEEDFQMAPVPAATNS